MKAIISKENLTLEHIPNFVRNDYGYSILFNIKYENDTVVSLSGASVRFKMRNINSTTDKVNRLCTINDPTNGICSYKPAQIDLDTQGVYNVELEVVTNSGQTVNTIQLGKVSVLEDI